jgi:hypothetical protein
LVTVVRVKLPPVLTIVIFAPTTAALDLSVTVPLMRPLVWALARAGRSRRARKVSPATKEGKLQNFDFRRWLFTMGPPQDSKFKN